MEGHETFGTSVTGVREGRSPRCCVFFADGEWCSFPRLLGANRSRLRVDRDFCELHVVPNATQRLCRAVQGDFAKEGDVEGVLACADDRVHDHVRLWREGLLWACELVRGGEFAVDGASEAGVMGKEGAAGDTLCKEVTERAAASVRFDVDDFLCGAVQIAKLDGAFRVGVADEFAIHQRVPAVGGRDALVVRSLDFIVLGVGQDAFGLGEALKRVLYPVAEGLVDLVPRAAVEQVLCALVFDFCVQALVDGPLVRDVAVVVVRVHAIPVLERIDGDSGGVAQALRERAQVYIRVIVGRFGVPVRKRVDVLPLYALRHGKPHAVESFLLQSLLKSIV